MSCPSHPETRTTQTPSLRWSVVADTVAREKSWERSNRGHVSQFLPLPEPTEESLRGSETDERLLRIRAQIYGPIQQVLVCVLRKHEEHGLCQPGLTGIIYYNMRSFRGTCLSKFAQRLEQIVNGSICRDCH